MTRSVMKGIPTRSVRNDNLNYRAALRVACRSGRSASSWRRRVSRTVGCPGDHLSFQRSA
ncbi:hypothetical protein F4W70_16850 [Pseudomonas cannabina]|nr:hypothetical protein F4W70_16850 [Pseudomonas cannabina]